MVSSLSGGGFVVSWIEDNHLIGAESFRRAQLFDANASKSGPEIVIATQLPLYSFPTSVSALSDNRLVMAWTDGEFGPAATDIHAQLYDVAGSKIGAEFVVNTKTGNAEIQPVVTTLTDGRFVIVWQDIEVGATAGGNEFLSTVRLQLFNTDGSRSGGEILVRSAADHQATPQVTSLPDGRFVVTWLDYNQYFPDTPGPAMGQVFNADGSVSGETFLLAAATPEGWDPPAIATLADGRFVASAADAGQIFDPRTQAITWSGTLADDVFVGTPFDDLLDGGTGADRLFGADGDDILTGGAGRDDLDGGNGQDTASYAAAGARVDARLILGQGFSGDASGDAYSSIENLIGGVFDDILQGDNGTNVLIGGNGDDNLNGLAGADVLSGGSGDDFIFGGTGDDFLTGGLGNDLFRFRPGDGDDTITDFQGGTGPSDRIFIDNGGTVPNSFGELTLMQSGANTIIDINGETITLLGVTANSLVADDFLF